MDDKLVYSQAELAKKLGVSERHLFNMRQRGELPFVHLGGRIVYPAAAIERWLAERTQRNRSAGDAEGVDQ